MSKIIFEPIGYNTQNLPANALVFQKKSDFALLQIWSTLCLVNDMALYLLTKSLEDLSIFAPLQLPKFCSSRVKSISTHFHLLGFLTNEWFEGQKSVVVLIPSSHTVFGPTQEKISAIALLDHWISGFDWYLTGFSSRFSIIRLFNT